MTQHPRFEVPSSNRRLRRRRDPIDDGPVIRAALAAVVVWLLICMALGFWVEHPELHLPGWMSFGGTVSQGIDRLDHGDAGQGTQDGLKLSYWPS